MPILKVISISPDDQIALWKIVESEAELVSMAEEHGLNLSLLSSFSHERRRREWLASRLAAKSIAPKIEITSTSGERPHSPTHHLSFSHSGDYAAAEVKAAAPAGMDIQEVNEKVIRIQQRFVHESEKEALDNPKKLALIWAAKEAMYKIYSDPYITFATDLSVDIPADDRDKGSIRGIIDRNGKKFTHDLYFELFENYALVCVK